MPHDVGSLRACTSPNCVWTLPCADINSKFCGDMGVEGKIEQSSEKPLVSDPLNKYNVNIPINTSLGSFSERQAPPNYGCLHAHLHLWAVLLDFINCTLCFTRFQAISFKIASRSISSSSHWQPAFAEHQKARQVPNEGKNKHPLVWGCSGCWMSAGTWLKFSLRWQFWDNCSVPSALKKKKSLIN